MLQGNLRAILDDVYALDKEEIGKLYAQNKLLIHLVRDLQPLSQAEAGQLPLHITSVDINMLANETIAIFTPFAQEKVITIDSTLAEQLPSVSGDADRLRQVLHNLFVNALRHTPEGVHIAISPALSEEGIQFAITDTGEGIAPELLPHVFNRFYRTEAGPRRDSGRVGLGLAISNAIIQAHNGHMVATSAGVNQGSTFYIYLPIENRVV